MDTGDHAEAQVITSVDEFSEQYEREQTQVSENYKNASSISDEIRLSCEEQSSSNIDLNHEDISLLDSPKPSHCILVETVDSNLLKFTKRDVGKAEVAKKLYSMLGRPSLKDYIQIIRQNGIKNCPVTVQDIERAIAIWGQDLGAVVGRTTRKRPITIDKDVFIRETTDYTILYIDFFFICGLTFLLSISKGYNLLVVKYLNDRKKDSAELGIREVIATYSKHNVKVKVIISDGESAITALKSVIEAAGVIVEQSSKNEHVAPIERAGRQVKERVRAFVNTLPFHLTKEMMIYLVYYLVSMINQFPRSTSMIDSISPKTKLTGKVLDFSTDCQLEFGDYVQANEENTVINSMKARTFPAICLGPVGNIQSSYYFMNLETWEVVKRRSWVLMPLPKEFIDKINAKAMREQALYGPGDLRFRIGNLDLLDEGDEQDQFEPVRDEILYGETKQTEEPEEEVDYEPHYFHEEPLSNVDVSDEIIEENPSPKYNLRKTPQREKWKEKFGLTLYGTPVVITYNVKNGIKQFGQEAISSISKEMTQLHEKGVFTPVKYEDLTPKQKVRVLRSLMFLKRKRDSSLKARFVANGSIQIRELAAIDPSSPTVSIEALFMSAAIDAFEKRVVATVDVEGAYLHSKMVGEVLMKIDPVISKILFSIDKRYEKFQLADGSLVVKLDKALYGCIESARLFYENISKALLDYGFTKNDYDPCVFNKFIYGKQCTVVIHVDDLKISCADGRGVEDVIKELTRVYGKINAHREKVLDYLGMDFDYSVPGCVTISMPGMVDQIVEEMEITESIRTPAAMDLFHVDEDLPQLEAQKKEKFHSVVAKLLYMAKRARPDILTAVAFLTTRCTCPTAQDWNKLVRAVKYLKGTRDLGLKLSADGGISIDAYIDASFACHKDGKSHTGQLVTIGLGAVFCKSSKQKLVAKSSTEAELIGLSDGLPIVLWGNNFLKSQGYEVGPATIHQDNKSTITLAEKGRSTTNRTRHVSIRYFFVKDRIESGDVKIVYTGTDEMVADFFSKPLQGHMFEKHRAVIMNL
jgi:hypothetical protein